MRSTEVTTYPSSSGCRKGFKEMSYRYESTIEKACVFSLNFLYYTQRSSLHPHSPRLRSELDKSSQAVI